MLCPIFCWNSCKEYCLFTQHFCQHASQIESHKDLNQVIAEATVICVCIVGRRLNLTNPYNCTQYVHSLPNSIFLHQSVDWRRVIESAPHNVQNLLFPENNMGPLVFRKAIARQTPTFKTFFVNSTRIVCAPVSLILAVYVNVNCGSKSPLNSVSWNSLLYGIPASQCGWKCQCMKAVCKTCKFVPAWAVLHASHAWEPKDFLRFASDRIPMSSSFSLVSTYHFRDYFLPSTYAVRHTFLAILWIADLDGTVLSGYVPPWRTLCKVSHINTFCSALYFLFEHCISQLCEQCLY
jgi:hypothetical protein